MSMSQEEIEALMSGADDMGFDETEDSVDDIVNEEDISSPESENEVDVNDILAGIDGITTEAEDSKKEVDVNGILAGINDNVSSPNEDQITNVDDMHNKINSSQYPMPVSKENKVVNQLNEVADDSEAKASQIFDILSFILDENSEILQYNKNMVEFLEKESELLTSLSVKFPNVAVFNENLSQAKTLIKNSEDITLKVDAENNKVFEAMEIMQYHDINRQKIERVMSVIKKLSTYLNSIFEDDSGKAEVQIAKHISGDSSDIVNAGDIESLISEYSK